MKKVLLIIGLFCIISCGNAPQNSAVADVQTVDTSAVLFNNEPVKIDSAVIKKLKPFFSFKKDEFESRVWYKPKTAPKYVNQNAIYCYFQVDEGAASNFRFCYQYYADDWLFIKRLTFLVDDVVYEFIPYEVKHDNDGGYIWEWFDEYVSHSDAALIVALANAKNVKVKLYGTDYTKVKVVSAKELKSIQNTYFLYKALGGSI